MSFSITQGIPATFIIGDAVSLQVSDSDHPATGWTSILYFKDDTGTVLSFARTSTSGGDHVFALTNANALTLVAGKNLVAIAFSDGTHRQVSDWTEVEVLADPTADETPSFAQAQVTLLRTVIAKFNATTHVMVQFNGQSFQRASIKDYQSQLVYWESRLRNEREQAKVSRGLPATQRRIPFIPV